MAKVHIVHCRICGGAFDTNAVDQKDWVMPSKNWYYHTKCYADWAKKSNDINAEMPDSDWQNAVWKYMRYELMIPMEFEVFQVQWKSYLKKGYTAKGINFAIRYFYDVKHGAKDKANGGIGIVDYIYSEGTQYWANHEHEMEIISEQIKAQMEEIKQNKKIIRVKNKPKKKNDSDLASFFDSLDGDE